MKWIWRSPALVIGAVLFIIGIPGIVEDVDTWAGWLAWLPEDWWVVPLGVGLGIFLFQVIFGLGKIEGRSEAELEALQSERSVPESEAESAPRAEPAPEPEPMSAPAAPAAEQAARVYTRRSLHELTSLAEGKTELTVESATQPHLGKWIKVAGALVEIERRFTYTGEPNRYQAFINCSTEIDGEQKYMAAHLQFDETWRERLEVLSPGDPISAHGKISRIRSLGVDLEECELEHYPITHGHILQQRSSFCTRRV